MTRVLSEEEQEMMFFKLSKKERVMIRRLSKLYKILPKKLVKEMIRKTSHYYQRKIDKIPMFWEVW